LTQPPLPDFRPRIEDPKRAVMTRTGQKTGGSLGAIQVGMVRVLLSAGVQPVFVVCASVGAINAAFFAGAPNADGVERLVEIWSGLRRREVFLVTSKSAFGLLRHPDSVIDSGGLRHLIETNLAYARLEDATVPVHITATDVQGMAVVLSKGPVIDVILASTAIPGVFPPVRIDGQTLMDGAIARTLQFGWRRTSERHGSSCFQLDMPATWKTSRKGRSHGPCTQSPC
jgi:predicted acylesterase/phospholipase RssA